MTEVVREGLVTWVNKETKRCVWSGLDADDSGQAIDLSGFPDKTAQVTGTYNGATLTLYGSNDATAVLVDRAAGTLFSAKTAEWQIVQDSLGNNFAKATSSTAGGDVLLENYQFLMPVVTGGGASTNLKLQITATRAPK